MNWHSFITIFGLFLLLVYGSMKILEFYGIGVNVYGSYIVFYLFLLLTYFVLPRNYFRFENSK